MQDTPKVAILEWKKWGGHCGAKEKSRGGNINVKYCWAKVICCMGQSSELEREIKQKTGGQAGGPPKNLGGPWPPLRIATARLSIGIEARNEIKNKMKTNIHTSFLGEIGIRPLARKSKDNKKSTT